MSQLKSKKWWEAAGTRAIRTVAQTAVATIGSSMMISEVNWLLVGSASIVAGVVSLLTSISGLPDDASLSMRFSMATMVGIFR